MSAREAGGESGMTPDLLRLLDAPPDIHLLSGAGKIHARAEDPESVVNIVRFCWLTAFQKHEDAQTIVAGDVAGTTARVCSATA